jgi:hypothetical protein
MRKLAMWLKGLLWDNDQVMDATEPRPRVAATLRQLELERDVLHWRDTYVTRIDRDMTSAFPDLQRRLVTALESNLMLVLTSRSRKFTETVIRPEVEAWVLQVVEPIRREASRTLADIDLRRSSVDAGDFEVSHLKALLLPIAAITAGIGVIIAGSIAAVTTTFFFFTSISWPIVLGTAGVGGALAGLGMLRLASIKEWLAGAFISRFVPKLHDALIGEGYWADGEKRPSLRRELQRSIEVAADDVLAQIAVE